ncbi:MAG: siderophore-interacting protein [Sneathiella sp.]
MPKQPSSCLMTVTQTTQLTPNMRRITFTSPGLSQYPDTCIGGYIKLIFPTESSDKPLMRTYTIRHLRRDLNEIDVDFVTHGDNGIASRWCLSAKTGDTINVAGPGSLKQLNTSADWYLVMADMSAMPAAFVYLETLPETASGSAYFEILTEADKQDVKVPSGIQINWHLKADIRDQTILENVMNLEFGAGSPGIFIAGEWSLATEMRRHLREDRKIDRTLPYVSSYWKLGSDDEDHKKLKRSLAS